MKKRFHLRNRYILFIDIVLIALSIVLSHLFRLELTVVYIDYVPTILWMLLVAYLIKPLIYFRFGLYQRFWAYASVRDAMTIFWAVSSASLLFSIAALALFSLDLFIFFPRSILVIDWMLSLMLVGGLRFAPRVIADGVSNLQTDSEVKEVLIVGAGDAGVLVVRELQKNIQLNFKAVAFLDDDPLKQNLSIHGVRVEGRLDDLESILAMRPIDEVIIAIPSAPGIVVRKVSEICRQKNIPFRTMPGVYELLGGKVSIGRLREVDINDLLRREHAPIEDQRVGHNLSGKRVLITGAGGSIASELSRQVAGWGPSEIILLGHGENSIFEIMLDLERNFPSLALHPVIANVRDRRRLQSVFDSHLPQVVFHAAAHKHVPLMEKNPEEAVTNNVLGTLNVVQVASAVGVERLVMISTDKAVKPTSVMGATKRIAEMIVLDTANRSGRAYSVVRFGNVLGSRGSVVPLFRSQIDRGGPVTVTHPDMERYFMTIPEAVHLVLQSFAMGEGGEIFLLNMGDPVGVLSLAEDMIRLAGLIPGRDIEIMFTGLRPGEKLRESLWDEGAGFVETRHPEINRLEGEENISGTLLWQRVDELVKLAEDGDVEMVVKLLDEIIPGAKIRGTPPLDLTSIA